MAAEKKSKTELVFVDFNSIDLLLLYPRFPSTIVIAGTPVSRKHAMGIWSGYHCVRIKNKPSPRRPYKIPVPRYKQTTSQKIRPHGVDDLLQP